MSRIQGMRVNKIKEKWLVCLDICLERMQRKIQKA